MQNRPNFVLFLLLIQLWLFKYGCIAQNKFDDVQLSIFRPNTDSSVFTAMQRIWIANQSLSYITYPSVVNPIVPRRAPLLEGEGLNGYILEGNLRQIFPIHMGRNDANSFWQTIRFSVPFGVNLRLTQDFSSPLLPQNNVIGIGVDKVLWDSYTKFAPLTYDMSYTTTNWLKLREALTVVNFSFVAQHYSNGQASSFYLSQFPFKRNNYRSGDFSTNFLRFKIDWSRLSAKRSLLTASLAYQWDDNWGGPLSYSVEQEKSYGKHRLLGMLQHRTRPFMLKIFGRYRTWSDLRAKKEYKVKKLYEFTTRLEPELIMDNLDSYNLEKKYRVGSHIFFQLSYLTNRSLGFVTHLYAGRDYLNIRYDDIIFTAQFGITLTLDKYIPPMMPSDYIVKEL